MYEDVMMFQDLPYIIIQQSRGESDFSSFVQYSECVWGVFSGVLPLQSTQSPVEMLQMISDTHDSSVLQGGTSSTCGGCGCGDNHGWILVHVQVGLLITNLMGLCQGTGAVILQLSGFRKALWYICFRAETDSLSDQQVSLYDELGTRWGQNNGPTHMSTWRLHPVTDGISILEWLHFLPRNLPSQGCWINWSNFLNNACPKRKKKKGKELKTTLLNTVILGCSSFTWCLR